MKRSMQWAVAAVAAATLVACGGGGSDTTPAAKVTSVKVAGDSLADSGTFGYKFTVQGTAATGTGSTPIWPERTAATYGQTLCPHYVASGATTFPSTRAACTNHAVAGARINYTPDTASPLSVQKQLADLGAAGYASGDLLLIDGGGNDASDLIGAYLQASTSPTAYLTLLGTRLDSATVSAAAGAGATGLASAGGAYMKALAVGFAKTIKEQALDKGAPRVAVLNLPAVTLTPKLRGVLASVSASLGATQAATLEALFDGWIQAFNAQLATSLAGDSRVTVVDFYTSFKDQAANPAQYQFTNVTTPVCGTTTFPACTEALLSANPPSGVTGADWWKSYAFADDFHPTPYAHQQIGQLLSRSLATAGWL